MIIGEIFKTSLFIVSFYSILLIQAPESITMTMLTNETNNTNNKTQNLLTEELVEELFVRFFTDVSLFNGDMCKCFWQLEKMYWYYLDSTKLKNTPSKLDMKVFLNEIQPYLLALLPTGINLDEEFEKWQESRKSIPRCKVILLDAAMENMVLTKGVFNEFLIFPGGKVEDTDQSLVETAIRECYEEVGLDITDKINPNLYFDLHQFGIKNRYFLVPNVDKNTYFLPTVNNEVEYVKWFPVADFPDNFLKHNLKKRQVRLITKSTEMLRSLVAKVRN